MFDSMAYQRHRAWINLCNGPIISLNGVCMKKLCPQEVDTSTSLLRAHIHFSKSSPRVRVLDICGFCLLGFYNLF
jgi:hypothetical protein